MNCRWRRRIIYVNYLDYCQLYYYELSSLAGLIWRNKTDDLASDVDQPWKFNLKLKNFILAQFPPSYRSPPYYTCHLLEPCTFSPLHVSLSFCFPTTSTNFILNSLQGVKNANKLIYFFKSSCTEIGSIKAPLITLCALDVDVLINKIDIHLHPPT
jgi:hypothetical protein